jgi:uncharacterized SAM-binding protein YcdF (DUF218 family)
MYHGTVAVLRPYTLLCLLALLAVLNLWRRRREAQHRLLLVTVLVVGLVVISTPALAYLLHGSLEWQYPSQDTPPADAEAIVVLGAGVNPASDGELRVDLDADSVRRCLHAAALHRQGKGCPLVLSGGKPERDSAEPAVAEVMRDFLLRLGVDGSDLIVESDSRTTYENAVECRRILERHHLQRVVLVTDAVHMPRAVRCFRKQGIEPTASPCNLRATRFEGTLSTFLPCPNAAGDSEEAVHEWLGTAWYWLCGRI